MGPGLYLNAVGQQLKREEEGEAFVGVPEDGRVPDREDQQGQTVVDKLRRAGPPGIKVIKLFFIHHWQKGQVS